VKLSLHNHHFLSLRPTTQIGLNATFVPGKIHDWCGAYLGGLGTRNIASRCWKRGVASQLSVTGWERALVDGIQ
jgi:hypothetical protein